MVTISVTVLTITLAVTLAVPVTLAVTGPVAVTAVFAGAAAVSGLAVSALLLALALAMLRAHCGCVISGAILAALCSCAGAARLRLASAVTPHRPTRALAPTLPPLRFLRLLLFFARAGGTGAAGGDTLALQRSALGRVLRLGRILLELLQLRARGEHHARAPPKRMHGRTARFIF